MDARDVGQPQLRSSAVKLAPRGRRAPAARPGPHPRRPTRCPAGQAGHPVPPAPMPCRQLIADEPVPNRVVGVIGGVDQWRRPSPVDGSPRRESLWKAEHPAVTATGSRRGRSGRGYIILGTSRRPPPGSSATAGSWPSRRSGRPRRRRASNRCRRPSRSLATDRLGPATHGHGNAFGIADILPARTNPHRQGVNSTGGRPNCDVKRPRFSAALMRVAALG